MAPLKIVLIGCVRFTEAMFDVLVKLDHVALAGVVTRSDSTVNSDHADLGPAARAANIRFFDAKGQDQDAMARWIAERGADVILCLGWSYLLKKHVLHAAPRGVIGYHPALLPRNRGRHPIIWALTLGLKETGSTFFQMDERADSGPILSQQRVAIVFVQARILAAATVERYAIAL